MDYKREYTEAEINTLVEERAHKLLSDALKADTPTPLRRSDMTTQQRVEFINKNGVDAYKTLPA